MGEIEFAKLTYNQFSICVAYAFCLGVVTHMFLIYAFDLLQFVYKILKKIKRFIRIRKLHRSKI